MNRTMTAFAFALLLSSAAHAAEPCRTVRFEDGSTARIRPTSGSLCEYDFRLVLKVGKDRKPLEIRSVTPDRCHVWVSERHLAKDKALIDKAWSACVDASQEAEEKENAKR